MCYEEITCPACSSLNIVKNGKTKQRKQRYLCKDCRRQFIRDYTYLGCVGAVRAMVVPLTMNGSGIRDIRRVLSLSVNTVLKTLREAATQITEPVLPKQIQVLELDEFWSFVRTKKQPRWTWHGFDRARRQVVAFVNGRRTDLVCATLIEKLKDCPVARYCTDDWPAYAKFLPAQHHQIGKAYTLYIERNNLNFRTHLKITAPHDLSLEINDYARCGIKALRQSLKFWSSSFVNHDPQR
jgi:insertion element IS1 protein InsB